MLEVSSVMQFVFLLLGGIALGFGFAVGSSLANRLMR